MNTVVHILSNFVHTLHKHNKEIIKMINHIAIYVENLEQMKNFYEKYFGGIPNNKYHNPRTGLETFFLSFKDGCRIELMTRPDIVPRKKELMSTGFIHLAFSVGSKENVDDITTRLKADGYKVINGPRTTGDGYYESCILDPEENQIEITE